MLYKAVVIDNSMLFTRGTIRVRIAGFHNKTIDWSLEDNFPDSLDLEENPNGSRFSNDYEARLTTSFGGGRNYGVLHVPQPNEKGLVAFMGNSFKFPIWMGGLFETTREETSS